MPQSHELAISSMKRSGVKFYHGWSYPTSIISVISMSAARAPTLSPSHSWSLYIELFTLDPTRMLQKMCNGQHKASCSPKLEESQLSVAGLAADISHFVALPQSHSYLELVPLGWWWHTMPTQLAQPYKGECPLQE